MRILRLMLVLAGMLGGAIGLLASANAAPIPVLGIVAEAGQNPAVAKAYYYFVRRRSYRPRYYRPRYYRPRYYRPRYFYRPRYYRPRYYRRGFFFF